MNMKKIISQTETSLFNNNSEKKYIKHELIIEVLRYFAPGTAELCES